VIYIAKTTFEFNIKKYIPIISIIFGMILGIAGYFIPNVEMGDNWIEAVFIGISAGGSSVGLDQVGKQLNKSQTMTIDD
jgi:hypothetical protein